MSQPRLTSFVSRGVHLATLEQRDRELYDQEFRLRKDRAQLHEEIRELRMSLSPEDAAVYARMTRAPGARR